MPSILASFRSSGPFLRRRDLLARGHTDHQIRSALAARSIFRVRQGWYATTNGIPDAAVRAIRVGGRLTGLSALTSYGLKVPRPSVVRLAVPRNACRLRRPGDKSKRLVSGDGILIDWVDAPRLRSDPSVWRVSMEDALLCVLRTEGRDVAVAACDAIMRTQPWSWERLDRVFSRAPARAQQWRRLVVVDSDAHGETFVRLWCADAGITFQPQPRIPGVGRLDGQIAPHTYVEIDGAQHAEDWEDDGDDEVPPSFEPDHDRDTAMTIRGDRVLRFTYRQLYTDWPSCLAAMERAILDDAALSRWRQRHPYVAPSRRKRRRSGRSRAARAATGRSAVRAPSF